MRLRSKIIQFYTLCFLSEAKLLNYRGVRYAQPPTGIVWTILTLENLKPEKVSRKKATKNLKIEMLG